jgi:hypothetical protein
MRLCLLLWILVVAPALPALAQDDDYYNPAVLRMEDRVYSPLLKTPILERQGESLSHPVIMLKSNEQLHLRFDWMEEEIKDFSYRIVHCDPEWKPSVLSETDYMEGFFTDHIITYTHSMNTLMPYWHYELILPNAQMKPLISGNYILLVFETAEPDSILLSRRFYVAENNAEIITQIHRPINIEFRNTHQEIDFKINLHALPVINPYTDVKVVITQNNNWEQRLTGLKPLFAANNILDYNYDDGNLLEGGSEFRNFDTRTTRFLTQNMQAFGNDSLSGWWQALLKPDLRRATQRYSSDEDLNGKFLVRIYEGRDGNTEGDYLKVIFRLKAPEDFTDGVVYLNGQFSDWQLRPEYRMNPVADSGYFEQMVYLKQGYYNYEYVVMEKEGRKVSRLETEGSHFETRNDYFFYVYWREPGGRYDRLVAYRQAPSGGM